MIAMATQNFHRLITGKVLLGLARSYRLVVGQCCVCFSCIRLFILCAYFVSFVTMDWLRLVIVVLPGLFIYFYIGDNVV